jgi:hypothetical protein
MADPTGKRGKILPILRHKFDPISGESIDLPFVLVPLKRFDFTNDRQFEGELEKLVPKLSDLPPSRGRGRGGLGAALNAQPSGQEAPDVGDEVLPSNLFPVLNLPTVLYSDYTAVAKKGEVWQKMKGSHVPPFVLHGGRLISFVPHQEASNPFKPFLTGTDARVEQVADWLNDADLRRQLIGMLNAALREHCYHQGIFSPKRDRAHFYCPIFAGGEPGYFLGAMVNAYGRLLK